MPAHSTTGPRDHNTAASRQEWERRNCVVTDDTFSFPKTSEMRELHKTQPWKTEPHYFNRVKVSVLAAMQMMIHAKRGSPNAAQHSCLSHAPPPPTTTTDTTTTDTTTVPSSTLPASSVSPLPSQSATGNEARRDNWFEVMGLMLGHFREGEMTVTSAFGLPVDASEVECSMNDASQLYMLDFLQYYQRGGVHQHQHQQEEDVEVEGCIGWYHSHPGYTCFLSGTDVDTQQLSQSAQDPWLAIVVDPVRTIATGRLDMKAFRTFPEAYAVKMRGKQQQQQAGNATMAATNDRYWERNMTSIISAPAGGNSSIISGNLGPSERIKEYGVHAYRYYELPITFVRSKNDERQLDRLWCRYWALTLSTNSLTSNRHLMTQQIHQLAGVLESSAAGRRQTTVATTGGLAPSGRGAPKRQNSQTRTGEEAFLAVADNNNNNDGAFEQSCVQMRYLTSALASEITLGGTLMTVKSAAFLV